MAWSEKFITKKGDLQKLYPVDEVAEILRISRRHVFLLAQIYNIKWYYAAGKYRIKQNDLDRMKKETDFLKKARRDAREKGLFRSRQK